jgi:predicted DNA-binding WGR domain protein
MKIEKQILLQLTDIRDNHNKFYRLTLYDNGRVLGEWGRVGAKPQQKVYEGGVSKFYSVLTAKERKGYRIVDTPTTKANIIDDLDGGSSVSEFIRTVYKASGQSLEVWFEGSLSQVSTNQIERGRYLLETIRRVVDARGGSHVQSRSLYRLEAMISDYYSL